METVRITMAVSGLTCGGGGSLAIERALAALPGVVRAYVNPATEMAYVEYVDGKVEPRNLIEAVERAGFQAGEVQVRSGVSSPAVSNAANVTAATLPAHPSHAAAWATEASGEDQREADQARDRCGQEGGSLADLEASGANESGQSELGQAGLDQFEQSRSGPLPPSGKPRANITLRLTLLAGFMVLILLMGLGLLGSQNQAGEEPLHSITMSANGFVPGTLVLPAGRPLTLKLSNVAAPDRIQGSADASTTHQFAVDELGIDFKLSAGETRIVYLPPMRPGTYTVYCSTCCNGEVGRNMQGTLIVHDAEGMSQSRQAIR
jgi:copper chaperone CopZ